ncbi:hypothetical protein, conserved [Trypanosoma brucei gambiense DAL972]|uniref:Uncharacterized protein n=1 Tax=Trypanosoma brucei gambiense (strain MHOM/CI/86/DAL972) TaxID=679716 RepID=D0AAV0_TRYB9|nr:hypothetical protein, conserved [Trypanosoma brucei gambiense DAL972]CBH18801.1 hypothetical protein, conserved [Trypanosoma brucei gambiense DAL972]|eukprot:XP_011781065.1 hypothetical protein, conserved [Trypanosoma brucei gambiense DAL972]
MNLNEVASGYFGDIPYCLPLECSAFFDALTSSRLHRIPQSMMSRIDSEAYYTDKNTRFHNLLSGERGTINRRGNPSTGDPIGIMDLIPYLHCASPADRIACNDCTGGCYIAIELNKSSQEVGRDRTEEASRISHCIFVTLDLKGIDHMWQSLLIFLLGGTDNDDVVYVLTDVDIYFHMGASYGSFMFSIWALAISSLLHHFASFPNDRIQERLSRVKVILKFSKDCVRSTTVDDIYLFIESKLKVCVDNKLDTSTGSTNNMENCFTDSFATANQEAWLEKMTEIVTNCHEELCDTGVECVNSNPSCILLIIPEEDSLVSMLEQCLHDSYTSSPMSIAASLDHFPELLAARANGVPLTVFCSKKKIEREFLRPHHECCFGYMDIKFLVFGESNRGEDLDIIRALFHRLPHTIYVPYPGHCSSENNFVDTERVSNDCLQDAMNVVLWLFRRFRFESRKEDTGPVLRIPESFFATMDASLFFDEVMSAMCSFGLLSQLRNSDGLPSYQLSVIGRALSYRFRLPYDSSFPELSPFDVKCIFWCHALRQPKAVAEKLICNSHKFTSWVRDAINRFCSRYQIVFTENLSMGDETLVRALSSIPKYYDSVSRVELFLCCTTGKRTTLSRQSTRMISTSCRGWFDQASPGTDMCGPQKSPVNIYCYPSHHELCEIHFGGKVLQCPLDVSYPLIASHIILHTALWNNAVFLECAQEIGKTPLLSVPLALLESPLFKRMTRGSGDARTGMWLDNCIGDNPSPSDAMELGSLMGRTVSFLGLCNCGRSLRKREESGCSLKRPRREALELLRIPSDAEVETIKEFVNLAKRLGRENAEKRFKTVKGFAFLNDSHENHPYYLHLMKTSPS